MFRPSGIEPSLETVDIGSIELLSGIPEEKRKSVLKCLEATVSTYEKGAYLARHAASTPKTQFLLEGCARIERIDSAGNRSILGSYSKGSLIGSDLMPDFFNRNAIDVVAVEPCQTLDFNISREVEGCSCCIKYVNQVKSNLMVSLAETNAQFMQRLDLLSCRTTRERVLSYLESQANQSGHKVFTIPYNRQELADYLCVERSALSRELGKMKNDGLIDFEKSTFRLLRAS